MGFLFLREGIPSQSKISKMSRLFYALLFAAMVFVANAGVHHYQVGDAAGAGGHGSIGHRNEAQSLSARGPAGGSFLNDVKSTGSKAFHQAYKGIKHVLGGHLF